MKTAMGKTEPERDFQAEADKHGEAFAERAAGELAALEHAQSCDGTDDEGNECKAGADRDNPETWHDEDAARGMIEEGPLSLEVRSGWYTPGDDRGAPEEFRILLGTGGPAARLIGELSEHGEPESASYEFQDWFKPWTAARLTDEQEQTILRWAQVFYFGG